MTSSWTKATTWCAEKCTSTHCQGPCSERLLAQVVRASLASSALPTFHAGHARRIACRACGGTWLQPWRPSNPNLAKRTSAADMVSRLTPAGVEKGEVAQRRLRLASLSPPHSTRLTSKNAKPFLARPTSNLKQACSSMSDIYIYIYIRM